MYNFSDTKVLVVEDMPPMLELTKSLLGIFGFGAVYGAAHAKEGYALFQSHKPDLVLTDWALEDMDGIALTEKIRTDKLSQNPYVPIVIMTGFGSKPRVEAARDAGVTEFLVKPFTSKDLYARIVQVIEKPRPFVESGDFFGPDRRRRKNMNYEGRCRRQSERPSNEDTEFLIDMQDAISQI